MDTDIKTTKIINLKMSTLLPFSRGGSQFSRVHVTYIAYPYPLILDSFFAGGGVPPYKRSAYKVSFFYNYNDVTSRGVCPFQ